jgi:hypothetical protein
VTGLALRDPDFDPRRMWEQCASLYLETLDRTGKPPRQTVLVESLCNNHPNYDAVQVATWLNDPEYDKYLQTRRREHLVQRTAAKLLAAEMGASLGVMALERIQERLENGANGIPTKDLVAVAKLGMDLNASIDKDLDEVTGNPKITVQIRDVLVGLPPERAAILMAELGRSMASPKAKGEVIDGTGYSEE